ncbi:MAG: histidine kinase [Clostridia bacterium]|nr:histidine kinase [Clostridia bacterium]
MKRRGSLVGQVLTGNFKVTIFVVVVVVITLFVSLCTMYRTTCIAEAKTALKEATHELRFEIESALQQTDTLVKNESIMENLDREFDDNYELIGFIHKLTSFVTSIEATEYWEIDRFIIYSENPTLVESGYIRKASALSRFDRIRTSAQVGMQYFDWKNEIQKDEDGRNYLTLYRYIPMKYDCIAELKLFTDSSLPVDNVYNVSLIRAEDYEPDALCFKENIIDGFVLTARVPNAMLFMQYIRYMLLLTLFALVFLGATYYLSARSVYKTMKDILKLIEAIESGDILDKDESERQNELSVIKNKIAELTVNINEITTREYESELMRRRLEMEVLNAKINPHLLYNSLSAIKLVAFKEKSFKIADVTDTLIEYYRLVLNKGEDTITVVRELEYLEKYIDIYEISKKMEYDVTYDVCEEAFDIEIPHMLLQPVLENALVHGLNSTADARIGIKVYTEGDKLHVDIGDNGVGIEKERLYSLNRRENLGYGLTSVIQRADFYYDGDFDFHMDSEVGKGTTVHLTIAKRMKKGL